MRGDLSFVCFVCTLMRHRLHCSRWRRSRSEAASSDVCREGACRSLFGALLAGVGGLLRTDLRLIREVFKTEVA